jgi:hypothetical protein
MDIIFIPNSKIQHFNQKDVTFCIFVLILYIFLTLAAAKAFKDVLKNFYALAKSRLWWFSRKEVDVMMPESFKKLYPKTRVIIDASEVGMEIPSDVDAAALFWSQYKHKHTIKFLLGIAPHGMISFISKAYTGRTTDGHLTAVSGLYDLLERGDTIMADKGIVFYFILHF